MRREALRTTSAVQQKEEIYMYKYIVCNDNIGQTDDDDRKICLGIIRSVSVTQPYSCALHLLRVCVCV